MIDRIFSPQRLWRQSGYITQFLTSRLLAKLSALRPLGRIAAERHRRVCLICCLSSLS